MDAATAVQAPLAIVPPDGAESAIFADPKVDDADDIFDIDGDSLQICPLGDMDIGLQKIHVALQHKSA
jgi:hypothetical protein